MAKIPSKITASYLENAALYYLQRFSASRQALRRVLARKIQRSAAHWGDMPDSFAPLLEQVITRMEQLGYIDDQNYAGQKVRSMNRQGKGERWIRAALSAKGIDAEQTAQALDQLQQDQPDAEEQAAWTLARKRRLGPYRPTEQRQENRARDLAALARAGFSFDTACRVIDADLSDAIS